MSIVSFEEFKKLDFRVGKIIEVKKHPNADKLLVLNVDFGESEQRTIVAGLSAHYATEELEGKKAIFAVNLEPVNLRGVESHGMILAASSDDKKKVVVLVPEKDIDAGSKVS